MTLKETCPEILAEMEASSEDIERAIEDEISDANETDVSQEDSTVLIASTSKKLLADKANISLDEAPTPKTLFEDIYLR